MRLRWLLIALLTLALPGQASASTSEPKVMRYAFRAAETSFDPTQLTDIYSRLITAHVFETLYA